MKLNFKTLALLALAGMAFNASAATTVYKDGDILLGFHASGGIGASSELVVNLGNNNNYVGQSSGFVLSALGSIGTDLTNTYGASWNTRADLSWGIVGVDDSVTDIFGSRAETTYGTKATAWPNKTYGTSAGAVGKAQNAGLGYDSKTSGTNASALVEANTDINHWTSVAPTLGGFFNPGVDGTFSGGVAANALDLFRADGSGPSLPSSSTYQGTFTISSAGQLSFGIAPPTVAAVPEPSRAALLFIGFASAVLRRRRK